MKKDESFKANNTWEKIITKNETKIQTQKPKAPKTFSNCDTCKLKNNASIKKNPSRQEDEVKIKRSAEISHNDKKRPIKLTDLCEEDKKRIEELMEELFKCSEKNRSLRESLEYVEKAKKNQHECFVKQASLHLEEKNMFLKEIQTYKTRLEACESEMKEKLEKWERKGRFMDNEIRFMAQDLQKSFSEKSNLMKEISYLKTCLKQSLKSFELLRNEVSSLQQLPLKSVRANSQIFLDNEDKKETTQNEESEDEYLSITTKDTQSHKTDLDVINNKLEQIHSLLRNKTVPNKSEKFFVFKKETSDSEMKVLEKTKSETEGNLHGSIGKNEETNNFQDIINRISVLQEEGMYVKKNDSNNRLLEPFNHDNKTSIQEERIIKKTGRLLNSECDKKLGKNNVKYVEEDSEDNCRGNTDFKNTKRMAFFRENNVDRMMDDEGCLLKDLFYSDAIVDLGLESALLLTNRREFDRSISNSLN